MSEGTTLAPVGGSALPMAGVRKTGTGFPGSSGAVPRKVVDYSAGIVKMLEVCCKANKLTVQKRQQLLYIYSKLLIDSARTYL